LGLVLITVTGAAAVMTTPAGAATGSRRPNIVLVLTDDLDGTSYFDAQRFPVFHHLMVEQGMTFSDYFVTDSLCCPSRASLLRGQYVHDTDVLGNLPPSGGFERFHQLGEESSTVATWLQESGYRTGLFGKYLNGYPATATPTYVPAGWDEWVSPSAGNPYAEYGYQLNENGKLVDHGSAPSD